MRMLLPGQPKIISGVMLVYVEQVPGLHRHYGVSTFCIPTLPPPTPHPPPLPLLFPRASKSFLVICQSFTSDASEDVEAALEKRTCLPIHSFALLFLVGQWIPCLLKILIGILQHGLGVVDGPNLQGGRGRAIVNGIVPSFLPHCLQFVLF